MRLFQTLPELVALERKLIERGTHCLGSRADGTNPVGERADRVDLSGDRLVAAFQLDGIREQRGGVVGCHAHILAAHNRASRGDRVLRLVP